MAEEERIRAGLSLDQYHEKISSKVVDAFRRRPKGDRVIRNNDVVPVGRARGSGQKRYSGIYKRLKNVIHGG